MLRREDMEDPPAEFVALAERQEPAGIVRKSKLIGCGTQEQRFSPRGTNDLQRPERYCSSLERASNECIARTLSGTIGRTPATECVPCRGARTERNHHIRLPNCRQREESTRQVTRAGQGTHAATALEDHRRRARGHSLVDTLGRCYRKIRFVNDPDVNTGVDKGGAPLVETENLGVPR
jgi:hypothetical protein